MEKVLFGLCLFMVIFSSCASLEDHVISGTISPTPQPPQSKGQPLTEEQAIKVGEKFIARNGYTDLPPDKENLALESIEWESNVDVMLRSRHNSLESKAYGVSTGRRGNPSGWTVGFKYKSPSDRQTRENGRAVTMELDGSDIRVEHVDLILKKLDKKL
jgi:hypothetical protein